MKMSKFYFLLIETKLKCPMNKDTISKPTVCSILMARNLSSIIYPPTGDKEILKPQNIIWGFNI